MLIKDLRQAWRFHSVQINALFATAATGWLALPAETQAAILEAVNVPPSVIVAVAFAVSTIARLVAQPSLDAPAADAQPR